jgi:hypothetical protein
MKSNTVTGTPTINAGTSTYTFWSAPIQVNTRALLLKSASFRVIGSAPSDALSNVSLYIDGVNTGKTPTLITANGSNYQVFDFMSAPRSLSTGSHTLDVRASVDKGSNRTVQFSIQQAADLMIMDPQVGVNVAVSGTIPNNAASITINPGSITATNDPTFQTFTNVTGGASNIPIAKYRFRAYGEDVKVSSLQVLPVLTSPVPGNTGLDDVTLYFNGSQVGTQQDWPSTGGNLTFQLGSQLIAPAGIDSTLEVRANIRGTTGTNYTGGQVSANLVVGSSNAQGQNSFTTISTPAVTGNILTIQTGLLAVSKNPGYANQSITPNTAGVKIGSFIFQNQSSSESVRVTSLLIGLSGTAALTNFSALRTTETSGSGSTPVQPAASNTFSVDFTLAPGATKTIDVLADTSSATTGTIIATLTATSIGSSSNVSATSTAIVGQTLTLAAGTVATPTLLTASATTAQYVAAGNGGATDATKATYNFVSTGAASTISELKFVAGSLPTAYTSGTITALGSANLVVGSTVGYVVGDVITVIAATTNAIGTVTAVVDATNLTVNYTTAGVGAGSLVVADRGAIASVKVGSATASPVGGVAYLTGLNLQVPNGGAGLTQDVLVTYSEVGTNGVAPGTTSVIVLNSIKYTSGGTTTTITPAVSAPTMTMVGSKPTVAVNLTQATGLILGAENKIGEITISADAKGNIKVNDIAFSVGSSNITTFAITSPRLADGTTTVPGTGCGANATATTIIFCEFGTVGDTFASGTTVVNTESNTDFDGYTITAGTSKTLNLYGIVGGTITTGGGTTTVSTAVSPSSGFNWDDTSTNGGTSSKALTGTLIYAFPTGSYSIRQ